MKKKYVVVEEGEEALLKAANQISCFSELSVRRFPFESFDNQNRKGLQTYLKKKKEVLTSFEMTQCGESSSFKQCCLRHYLK